MNNFTKVVNLVGALRVGHQKAVLSRFQVLPGVNCELGPSTALGLAVLHEFVLSLSHTTGEP